MRRADTYKDSHERLLRLRERLWEGYLLGGFGDYLLTDYIAANFTSCALENRGCISMRAYELDALGIGAAPPIEVVEEAGPGLGLTGG